MKKYLLLIIATSLLLFSSINIWAQQYSTIKGQINTIDNHPIENITIRLENKATITNNIGIFELKDIKAGNYTLIVSGIGYISQKKKISITENEILTVNFNLEEDFELLTEVIIQHKNGKYIRQESTQVSKMPLKNIENPQVYTTITSDVTLLILMTP